MFRLLGLSGALPLLSGRLFLQLALISAACILHGAHAADVVMVDGVEPVEIVDANGDHLTTRYDPAWRAPNASTYTRDRDTRDISEALTFEPLPAYALFATDSAAASEFASWAPTESSVSVQPFVSVIALGLLIISIAVVASINSRRQWRIGSPASKLGTLAEQAVYGSRRWFGPKRVPLGRSGPVAPAQATWAA